MSDLRKDVSKVLRSDVTVTGRMPSKPRIQNIKPRKESMPEAKRQLKDHVFTTLAVRPKAKAKPPNVVGKAQGAWDSWDQEQRRMILRHVVNLTPQQCKLQRHFEWFRLNLHIRKAIKNLFDKPLPTGLEHLKQLLHEEAK
jgi:hypothetical protein